MIKDQFKINYQVSSGREKDPRRIKFRGFGFKPCPGNLAMKSWASHLSSLGFNLSYLKVKV